MKVLAKIEFMNDRATKPCEIDRGFGCGNSR